VGLCGLGFVIRKFNKELTLEIEHHADISSEDDISNLCVLKACMICEQDLYEMYEVPGEQYQYSVGMHLFQ